MRLTILKWTMLVPILFKIFYVQADRHSNRNACLKSDFNHGHRYEERALADNPRHRKNGKRKIHRRMTALHGNIEELERGRLAQKLAKEALKSPEVQETIRKLSIVKAKKKNPREIVKMPKIRDTIKGRGRKLRRHRKRRKKKRKNRMRKVPHKPKRREGVNLVGGVAKHTNEGRRKENANSNEKIVKYKELKTKSEDIKAKPVYKGTNDLNALNPDVLKDILANRIQIKLREPENRFIRETFDNSSIYMDDQLGGSVQEYSSDSQILDDPLLSNNVGGITTETMLITDMTAQHFDPVTVADVPTNNLDLSSGEKFTNDIFDGSFNPISDTKVDNNIGDLESINNQTKKIDELSKDFSSTESFSIDVPYRKDLDPPPIYLPNPMQQPLAKVLESLRIDANVKQIENATPLSSAHSKKLTSHHHRKPSGRKVSSSTLSQTEMLLDYTTRKSDQNFATEFPSAIENDNDSNRQGKESTTELYQYRKASEKPHRKQTIESSVKEKIMSNSKLQNIIVSRNETKEVAHEILDEIMHELRDMKTDHPKDNNAEGSACRLTGSWLTSQTGLRFDMSVSNRTITVEVSRSHIRPGHQYFPINSTWNISGHAPFKIGAPFSLLATDNSTKSMAVFVGTCRVCQGVDTIAGIWSVAHKPTDCREFHISTSIFNDIFRRIKHPSHAAEKQTTEISTTERTENRTSSSKESH